MKNIFLRTITAVLLLSSCNGFLDENPKELAAENFYKTSSELESAVFASYQPLISGQTIYGRQYHTIHMSQVDYGYGRGSYAPITNFQGLDPTNVSRAAGMWTNFYLSIRNANLAIKNSAITLASGVPEATVKVLVAEAKFIRAFCYFHLVQNWAGVPIRTEANMEESAVPRASVEEVYALIESDLKDSEMNLPPTQPLVGRATKWAAKTMYADVLVNLKRWNEARNKAAEVIQTGGFELLPVLVSDDYYKIFGPDVISTKEEVFYLKFSSTMPNNFVFMLHHPSSPYNGGDGAFGLYTDGVENREIAEWDNNDLRKSYNLYLHNIGLGSSSTMLYKKFIEPDKTLGLSSDFPVYRLADVLLLFAESSVQASAAPTAEAIESINKLRRRAYGKSVNAVSTVDYKLNEFSTKDALLDAIYKERMYELFCEGKRFLELKRTGKLEEAILKNHNKTVNEKHLLWPIPNVEYFYNDAIDEVNDQNVGY